MENDKNIIILDGLDFLWNKEKLNDVVALHNEGYHVFDIAKIVKRKPAEVLLALVHVAKEGEVAIKPLQPLQEER